MNIQNDTIFLEEFFWEDRYTEYLVGNFRAQWNAWGYRTTALHLSGMFLKFLPQNYQTLCFKDQFLLQHFANALSCLDVNIIIAKHSLWCYHNSVCSKKEGKLAAFLFHFQRSLFLQPLLSALCNCSAPVRNWWTAILLTKTLTIALFQTIRLKSHTKEDWLNGRH